MRDSRLLWCERHADNTKQQDPLLIFDVNCFMDKMNLQVRPSHVVFEGFFQFSFFFKIK
jgi:hypothetical protein